MTDAAKQPLISLAVQKHKSIPMRKHNGIVERHSSFSRDQQRALAEAFASVRACATAKVYCRPIAAGATFKICNKITVWRLNNTGNANAYVFAALAFGKASLCLDACDDLAKAKDRAFHLRDVVHSHDYVTTWRCGCGKVFRRSLSAQSPPDCYV